MRSGLWADHTLADQEDFIKGLEEGKGKGESGGVGEDGVPMCLEATFSKDALQMQEHACDGGVAGERAVMGPQEVCVGVVHEKYVERWSE